MKIGYLGSGAWGFCLANMLAGKGYDVVCWTLFQELADRINSGKPHPNLPGSCKHPNLTLTTDLQTVLSGKDYVVESVTSKGLREVLQKAGKIDCPFILTSKGIEQDTGLTLPEVSAALLCDKDKIALVSGPSFASEVVQGMPTSVVSSAFNPALSDEVSQLFTTESFRVYPNADILGVAYGGALKNVLAIACGITEGMNFGASAKAALMTRGLHEIRKLGVKCGCRPETFYGLSGMGDLCLTCNSMTSRNFQFGYLLAKGKSAEEAQKEIGMVVEGVYTVVSAHQLSQKHRIDMPITDVVYSILHGGLSPKEAVVKLMSRKIKEEHL
ncbi:MAG: NAD(P)H-dependent glycerol-3-phosphate dehydrogenase [Waddliaceae bacterium]